MTKKEIYEQLKTAYVDEELAIIQYSDSVKLATDEELIGEFNQHIKEETIHSNQLKNYLEEHDQTIPDDPEDFLETSHCGYIDPKFINNNAPPTNEQLCRLNLEGEICAVKFYEDLLKEIPKNDQTLIRLIEKILDVEYEHVADLTALLPED